MNQREIKQATGDFQIRPWRWNEQDLEQSANYTCATTT